MPIMRKIAKEISKGNDHDALFVMQKKSKRTEKISEGKSWTIDIDGKRMVTQILRVRNICSPDKLSL